MEATHSLIFQGSHNNTREIAQIPNCHETGQPKTDQEIMDEAGAIISDFCAKRNYKIHYTHVWNADGITIIDVGSHTEFFNLIPALFWEGSS